MSFSVSVPKFNQDGSRIHAMGKKLETNYEFSTNLSALVLLQSDSRNEIRMNILAPPKSYLSVLNITLSCLKHVWKEVTCEVNTDVRDFYIDQ